ncbi:MAG: phosphate ABC transporter ATP-binding protein [Chloroflexi bacterium]|nr:MAG: phosphate ABC transporter ATP-binding protein [Chloroflexota bacterium]
MKISTNNNHHGPVYRLMGLTKSYCNRIVLDIDSLDIQRGEIFAMVGPSGAGKSTLLRLMNFLEEPTGGQLEFEGAAFRAGSEIPLELKRRVTMVFQRPMLLNSTVWDNVTYGLRLRGLRNTEKPVVEALEEVGLAHLMKQKARTLSGGEAQRVSLARAIVLKPDVLLLDEPTANLDPYNVSLIENIVRRINEQYKTTLVLVTHNVFQAKRLASRVAFLLEGKLIEVAESEKFFQSPADPRTDSFVRGDMVY